MTYKELPLWGPPLFSGENIRSVDDRDFRIGMAIRSSFEASTNAQGCLMTR
jgi:hypothetical protein